jgi:CBS domain-containing protein
LLPHRADGFLVARLATSVARRTKNPARSGALRKSVDHVRVRIRSTEKIHQVEERMRVANVLKGKSPGLLTVKPNETIGNLARKLQQNRIGVMVVSHDGRSLDGIISERDIAYSLAERRGELHLLPVSALMTRRVVTCSPESSLSDVMHLMHQHHIRHVPVADETGVVGILSMRDVLEFRLNEVERKSKSVQSWLATSEH